jgi:sulfite exporter TauE/SafE
MFTAGLTGGFGHCMGMCGPVVLSYSISYRKGGAFPHILYNLGRITTYTLMGGVIGFTGSFIAASDIIYGFQKTIMLVTGALILLMGLGMAGWLPLVKKIEDQPFFSSLINRALKLFPDGMTAGAFYPMGLLLGFLPCGLVYTALLTAARSGMEAGNHLAGLIQGALLMLLFGIGTMPALLLFGRIIGMAGEKIRGNLYRISAIIMIVTGIIFIARTTNL